MSEEDLVPGSFLHLRLLSSPNTCLENSHPLRDKLRFRVPPGREPQEVSACEEQGLRPSLELPALDVNTAQHRPYTDFLALFCSSKAGPRRSLQCVVMRTPENASPLIQGLQCLREAWMLKPCRPHRNPNENN